MNNKALNNQFNIPSWVRGKTPAEEAKAVQKRFSDRKDKASVETMEEILQAIANKQEYVKMQEGLANQAQQVPDQMNGQVPQQFAKGGSMQDFYGTPENVAEAQKFNSSVEGAVGTAASVNPIAGAAFAATRYLGTPDHKVGTVGGNMLSTMFSPWKTDKIRRTGENRTALREMGNKFGADGPSVAAVPLVGGFLAKGIKQDLKTWHGNKNALKANDAISGRSESISSGSANPTGAAAYGGKMAMGGPLCGGPGQVPCKEEENKFDWAGLATGVLGVGASMYGSGAFNGGGETPSADGAMAMGGPIDDENKTKGREQVQRSNDMMEAAMNGIDGRAPLDYGKYKDRGFFNTLDQGVSYDIRPSKGNPQNAQGYKEQMKYLQQLNPEARFNSSYEQFGNRMAYGGVMGNCGGPGQPPCENGLGDTRDPSFDPSNKPMPYQSPVSHLKAQPYKSSMDTFASPNIEIQPQPKTTEPQSGGSSLLKKVGKFAGANYDQAGQLIPLVNMFNKYDKGPASRRDTINPNIKTTPTDLAANKNIVAEQASANRRAAVANSGGSVAKAQSNLALAGLNASRGVSDAYRAGEEVNRRENSVANMFRQRAGMFNAQQSNQDLVDKQMDTAAVDNAKQANKAAVVEDMAAVFKNRGQQESIERMFGYTRKGKYIYNKEGEKVSDKEYRTKVQQWLKDNPEEN